MIIPEGFSLSKARYYQMFLRIHRSSNNREVVGICDRELIGKTISEGDLSLKITESFFGDKAASEEEVMGILQNADNITIYGNRCIALAIREGIIDEADCRKIGGILTATIIRI